MPQKLNVPGRSCAILTICTNIDPEDQRREKIKEIVSA
jgi:hypothetical protein